MERMRVMSGLQCQWRTNSSLGGLSRSYTVSEVLDGASVGKVRVTSGNCPNC